VIVLWLALLLPVAQSASPSPELVAAVRNAECAVGCRRGGWDDGWHVNGLCGCVDWVKYDQVTGKRPTLPVPLPSARPEPSSSSTTYQYLGLQGLP